MCVWVLLLFQTYSRCDGFVCSIDFGFFFLVVSLFSSGGFGFFLGFGGVISAQENNLASNCPVVFG